MEIAASTVGAIALEGRGSTLGLVLTDPTPNTWELTLEAGVGPAFGVVGRFVTAAPSAGSGSTRWIGWAHAPGATAWRVSWRIVAGPATATADLAVDVSNQTIPVGLNPNAAFAAVVP